MQANGFFDRMAKEAMDEIASGNQGWKEANPNVLLMAAFGLLSQHLSKKIATPLWWFAGSVSAVVIAYIVNIVIA